VKPCRSPALGGSPLCDLPEGHAGPHAVTQDGHTYRWGTGIRRRRIIQVTLSEEARKRLDFLASLYGEPRSQTVERLVMRARTP
jgi:hypothetical protein